MANNEVWTVRGVPEAARKQAKAGAAAEGVSIGEWLERAIQLVARADEAGRWDRKFKKAAKAEFVEHAVETVVSGPVSSEVEEAVAQVPGVVGPVLEAPAAKGRTRSCCQHGVEKGFNCWQCGGLAVIG